MKLTLIHFSLLILADFLRHMAYVIVDNSKISGYCIAEMSGDSKQGFFFSLSIQVWIGE